LAEFYRSAFGFKPVVQVIRDDYVGTQPGSRNEAAGLNPAATET
jgi:hypothetical protein